MKKFIKLFVCVIAVFALAGCGLSKDNANNNDNTTNTDSTVKEEKTNQLEKFVEENKEAVENLSNSVLDATLVAKDNSLVYVYTYKTTYDASVLGTMKESLETSINNQASTFNSVLDSVRTIAPDTKAVIIEYYNGDGNLITSIEFK